MIENTNCDLELTKDQYEIDENQQECAKYLTDLFDVKKVKKIIELNPKRRANIGKLIKSVANCYDCRVSKFDDSEKVYSEDESTENDSELDYYEIELVSKTNKIVIKDKRFGNKHELNLDMFRDFLENKLDVEKEENSDKETTDTGEREEEQKFHFLKFELILREFYQKNEIRNKIKNLYNTNEVKKVNLPFSFVKQPAVSNTYQGKSIFYASPAIRKNFFEDHKEEIKKIDTKRRKTMVVENNMFDKLRNELVDKKYCNSQVPRNNVNLDQTKEDKISLFSENVEELKDTKEACNRNSMKIAKRTSIFDLKLSSIVDEELEEDQRSNNSRD